MNCQDRASSEQTRNGDLPKDDGSADHSDDCAIESVHSYWRVEVEVGDRADLEALLTRLKDALECIRGHCSTSAT